MYPLIFAWKPLFLQVLCDADCFSYIGCAAMLLLGYYGVG